MHPVRPVHAQINRVLGVGLVHQNPSMDEANKVSRRTQSLSQLVLPSSSGPRVEYGSKAKTSRRPRYVLNDR